ncbi:MAG TPA: sensor domain-containing diguanylate cyclase [Acidimicrobiales bacterium]|nr:sensor domain-containing diguanylate cyclase [Acidimicrobiales bacterium]
MLAGPPPTDESTDVAKPIGDDRRLEAVAGAQLHGHLGDTDLDAVVSTLAIAIRVPMAVINVVTPNRQTYVAEVGVGAPFTTVEDRLSFCARVVETGRSMVVADAASHRTYAENPLVLAGQIGAYAGEPLVDSGFVIGSVAIFETRPRVFTDDELRVLRHQSQLASVVLALRKAARADPLTGLPNRALLMDRLEHALARSERQSGHVAVFFLDVDDFKGVNDRFGHAAGDLYLVELAQRIGEAIRPGDTLARLGGDEFVVVSEDLSSEAQAGAMAERLLSSLARANGPVPGLPIRVSIGVALAPGPAVPASQLLAQADAAMYRAKRRSGSRWEMARPVDGASRS